MATDNYPVETICFWRDSEDAYHLTRCTVDLSTGMPIGLPPNAESMLIIEFDKEDEPTFYEEALITEMGVDNTF